MATQIPSSPPALSRSTRNLTPDFILMSSPSRFSSSQSQEAPPGKPKMKATVTPRTFTRFFTPRSSLCRGKRVGASRHACREVTASGANRKAGLKRALTGKDAVKLSEDNDLGFKDLRRARKRKMLETPETTPDRSSPLKRLRRKAIGEVDHGENEKLNQEEDLPSDNEKLDQEEDLASDSDEDLEEPRTQFANSLTPIIRSGYRGHLGGVLRRQLSAPYNTLRRSRADCRGDWQSETMSFQVRPEDSHTCTNLATSPPENVLPFCTTSCNTNSLVAVGDEDGGIRLLESAANGKTRFSQAFLTFRPHTNAILDLEFSPDDMLLATASGDQSSQIVDMPTQRAVYNLPTHISSVKQVRFQPGSSNSVIATSSRDGSVQIWDLRCKGSNSPIQDWKVSLEPFGPMDPPTDTSNPKMTWARPVNSIYGAHAGRPVLASLLTDPDKDNGTIDNPSKAEPIARRGDVSITAISFLPPGREYLLLTGSEADATVKIWDLRVTHHQHRGLPTPVSRTRPPESHDKHRHFGLTSMALNGNGSRLYTLCRDNTVYAYSTSHLILGHAPELSSASTRASRSGGQVKNGLGPLYGFRHPSLHVATFYVKLAVRPAFMDKSELLAVGSSDSCAVIFPTDERHMHGQTALSSFTSKSATPTLPSSSLEPVARTGSGTSVGTSSRLNDTIPIYQHGSALVRGHSMEVTGVAWTTAGELITVGDDHTARCWREGNGEEARDLRTGGEKDGRRWGCGWAELGEDKDWDDDG